MKRLVILLGCMFILSGCATADGTNVFTPPSNMSLNYCNGNGVTLTCQWVPKGSQ